MTPTCRACGAALPLDSAPSRFTCGDRCRQALSRRHRREALQMAREAAVRGDLAAVLAALDLVGPMTPRTP